MCIRDRRNTNADALSRIKINMAEVIKEDVETEEEKRRIIEEYHDSTLGGHQGISRTYNRIKLKYEWPIMKNDMKNILKDVIVVNVTKVITTKLQRINNLE